MLKQVIDSTNLVMEETGEARTLTYSLVTIPHETVERYGLEVEISCAEGTETRTIPDLSYDPMKILGLIGILRRYTVTPCTAEEIVRELMI